MTGTDRPALHLTPPSGWMNDPNGLAFVDGTFHAFYQYRPDAPRWGRMRWGHAISRDLVTWEHLPIALEPGPGGPDRAGCWSGCLAFDRAGRPTVFYTGVVRQHGRTRPSICAATSNDGLRTWVKASGGPVIRRPPPGIRPDSFRDPFVWPDGGGWAMLVGAGTDLGRGTVLLYRSDDLRTWRYVGPFLTTEDVVAGAPDVLVDEIDSQCWECPQLVRLGDVDVLVVSVVDRAPRVRPAHVVAFTGKVTGSRFVVSRAARLGLGPDFYAPSVVTAPDGRRLLFGWIPEDPPRRGSARTWAGCLTFPRVVSVDADGQVRITLAAEVERFSGPTQRLPDATVQDDRPWVQVFRGGCVELRMSIVPDGAASIRLDVAGAGGTAAEIRFDPRHQRLSAARTSRVLVAGRELQGTTVLPGTEDGALHLRLILDGSVLELAADDRVTATVRMPEVGGGARTISCTAIGGGCRLADLEVTMLGEP